MRETQTGHHKHRWCHDKAKWENRYACNIFQEVPKGYPEKKSERSQKNIHINNVQNLKEGYPEQCNRLGNFAGEATLTVKEDSYPSIDAPRKCPIHVKDELKLEIDKLIIQGVIRKVDEQTYWCSSLAFSTKKDGSMRICIDPQRLNNSHKGCPHKIPTVVELNPQFANSPSV